MGRSWKRTTFRSAHHAPMFPVIQRTRTGSMPSKGTPSPASCRKVRAISAAPRQRLASRARRCTDGRQKMAYSRFQVGVVLRTVALALTIVPAACLIAHTRWDGTIRLCLATALAQIEVCAQLATHSRREVEVFLESISFDDTS